MVFVVELGGGVVVSVLIVWVSLVSVSVSVVSSVFDFVEVTGKVVTEVSVIVEVCVIGTVMTLELLVIVV